MAGGRQLQFDKQYALEQAMLIFWEKGFVGTSLSELTIKMGINKPSLYATFGNKEELYVSATQHYIEQHATPHIKLLHTENQSFKTRLKDYLSSIATMLCDEANPGGCYVAVALNELAGESLPPKASQTILDASQFAENYLREFVIVEKNKGDLKTELEAEELSLMLFTFLHGIAAIARNGKSLQQIQSAIDIFVKTLKI